MVSPYDFFIKGIYGSFAVRFPVKRFHSYKLSTIRDSQHSFGGLYFPASNVNSNFFIEYAL